MLRLACVYGFARSYIRICLAVRYVGGSYSFGAFVMPLKAQKKTFSDENRQIIFNSDLLVALYKKSSFSKSTSEKRSKSRSRAKQSPRNWHIKYEPCGLF